MADEDAAKSTPRRQRNGVRLGPATPVERYVVIALGFILVAAFLAIIFLDIKPDATQWGIVRVLLALMAAAAGALLPGFIEVDGQKAGWQLRAGGAVALFVMVFFGLAQPEPAPAPAPPPAISFRTLSTLDIRAGKADNPENSSMAVVLGVGFDSEEPVTVQSLTATLEAGETVSLVAVHYTALTTRPDGGWLPHDGNFAPGPFEAGNREIAFYPRSGDLKWGDFARDVLADPPGVVRVTVNARLNDSDQLTTISCTVDFSGAARRAQRVLQETRHPPSRLSINVEPQCS
jgi:hypothetical protein